MAQEISDEKHLKKLINFPNSWNDSIKEYLKDYNKETFNNLSVNSYIVIALKNQMQRDGLLKKIKKMSH